VKKLARNQLAAVLFLTGKAAAIKSIEIFCGTALFVIRAEVFPASAPILASIL
jgi:hypothetical protein